MKRKSVFLFGLDLGQAQDFTAMVALEVIPPEGYPWKAEYHLRHLERFDLGTPYPEIITRTRERLLDPRFGRRVCLVVDATGVGRAVVDLFIQSGLNPFAITITGGDTVTHERRDYRVPKRDLVGAMQVLLHTERIRFAERLPLRELLIQELTNFRVKIDLHTAHDSYESWREGQHDDLVLAVALPCWLGEQQWWAPLPKRQIIFRRG